MGCIRTLLAISVVFAHTYGVVFTGGLLAVQLFYIVSGFLISFVLTEAGTYRSTRSFYINRFLRLFPIYWVVAMMSLVAVLALSLALPGNHEVVETFLGLGWDGRLALIVSNLTLFGQDWILFTGVRNGALTWVSDFKESEIEVWQGLLVPQAWTLGIELSFYILAPFILTRRWLIVVFLLLSLGVRAYLVKLGIALQDPWIYRFFPAELALFLLGALSHQIWLPFLTRRNLLTHATSTALTAVIAVYCTIYFLLPIPMLHSLILIGLFIICLPFLFTFQRNRAWDRAIGELSYPIYICHMLVIWTLGRFNAEVFGLSHKSVAGSLIIVAASILFSIALNSIVGRRVDRWRAGVKARQAGASSGRGPRPVGAG